MKYQHEHTDPEINLWETGENFGCIETTFHGQINHLRWTISDIISLLQNLERERGTVGQTAYELSELVDQPVTSSTVMRNVTGSNLKVCHDFLSVPFTSYLYSNSLFWTLKLPLHHHLTTCFSSKLVLRKECCCKKAVSCSCL